MIRGEDAPGADDQPGMIGTDHRQAIGADDFAQSVADGTGQGRAILGSSRMVPWLPIRWARTSVSVWRATEGVALGQKLCLKLGRNSR